jgi:hypothetical protein
MSEKKAPRLTPEQNEARQANRAAKRERAKDARLLADMAVRLWTTHPRISRTPEETVKQAAEFLAAAKEHVG